MELFRQHNDRGDVAGWPRHGRCREGDALVVDAQPHASIWAERQQTPEHTCAMVTLPAFEFESGAVIPSVDIAYETWGRLNADRDNAVVICHALTGDAHAGPGQPDGWWSGLIGPGAAIDTRRYFVIASNVLGGCAGSTGPASLASDGKPYGLRFPLVTVRDMVNAQIRLIDQLGVRQVHAVLGGSLGGMQVWEWPLLAPGRVKHAVVMAAHAAFPPLAIGYNEAMRQAIVCDPNWCQGNYYAHGVRPAAGLAAARSVGMLTYRSDVLYQARFGRERHCVAPDSAVRAVADPSFDGATAQALAAFTQPQYAVESYLHYQGAKLDARFDANSYLYLTRAMDSHDIGRDRGGIPAALQRFGAKLVVIAIDTDYLYAAAELQAVAETAARAGVDCCYLELASDFGHDAFLLEQERLGQLLRSTVEGGRTA